MTVFSHRSLRVLAQISLAFVLSCCLLWALRPALLVAAPSMQETPDASDLILVGLDPTVNPTELSTYFEGQGFQLVEVWPAFNLAAVRPLPSMAVVSAAAAVNSASALPGVRFAEADIRVEAAVEKAVRDNFADTPPWVSPNDTLYPDQWALSHIGMPTAWRVTHGSPSVVVAIIDSGVDVAHEDLSLTSVYSNGIEVDGVPGVDDDNNGYVDDLYGWDWIEDNAELNDPYGHGTHVAGALIATTNNDLGVAGASPNVRILPLRILDQRGAGYISDLVSALDYARNQGADIVNLSLVLRSESSALYAAIQRLYAEGVLIITVTGNNGPRVYWPGVYTETIAVAAVGFDDLHASFSNVGPETDIAAPGDGVLSTYKENGYREWQGTSFAAPYVAATAGLIWSLRPDLPREDVVDILLQTAADVNAADYPGLDPYLGHGRLDAGAALMQASAGVQMDLQLPPGSYFSVGQSLQIPIRVTVTDTQTGAVRPVQGAVVEVSITNEVQSDAPGGAVTTAEQRFYSDELGYVVGTLTLPAKPGMYTLSATLGVQTAELELDVKAAPLAVSLVPEQPDIQVASGTTALHLTARTQEGELYTEDLLVHLSTDLGQFSDGSQSRTVLIAGGRLTETLSAGTTAGIAQVALDISGQKQQISVLVKPGMPARIEGPPAVLGLNFGDGATVEFTLRIYDQYGNQVWAPYPVNFYSTSGFFSPSRVQSANGEVTASFTMGPWVRGPQPIWAMIPGTFAVYQVDAVLLSEHWYMPLIDAD